MKDYLNGYLDVLPAYQKQKIEDILKNNQNLYNISSVTEEEFKELINRLAEEHSPLTEPIPQIDKLDGQLYNSFFTNTYIDLNLLFLESLMIESATTNYERIFDGIISDLDKETRTLRQRVESLKLINEGEDGLVVKQYSFDSVTEMEDRNKFSTLFVDRDGTPINSASFEQRHDEYFIALAKTKETDVLRTDGLTTAKIQIEDRRGVPSSLGQEPERYRLENAIDSDPNKYWAEVVLTDEPIDAYMKKG